ncbi:MAG: hypothetical protein JJ971_05410 [Balneolaceae bacterium]|nr:hypothetical protein [Balneolaceae bacterium]MBO6545814.1 hypothetical protein [Balneolaceae bacterium]MBO6647210.1 hypothetical protein [Balneolaceae bacterium]
MNKRKWLVRVLILSIFLITGQACTTNSDNDFSPIKEKGKTLLPNLNMEKFIPENSLGGEIRSKTEGATTIEWESIEKLLKQAQDQTEAELIAVFSIRDSMGVWYNYYLQPLGFSPQAMEEANGKTQLFVYELDKDGIGSVPRIAIAVIPKGEQAFEEMENWILPKVDTEPEQEKLKSTCEYVKVAPAATVCWRGGCTYYPPIYEWDCSGGGSSNPSWNWPTDDGDKSGGSGSGGIEENTKTDCNPLELYLCGPPSGVPVDVYDRLTVEEKKLCWQNPTRCIGVYNLSIEAFEWAASVHTSGAHNGTQDALRHAMWNALMTYDYDKEYAKKWGDAHESGSSDPRETIMDLYNNSVGREIGEELKNQNEPRNNLKEAILNASRNGELCVDFTKCG